LRLGRIRPGGSAIGLRAFSATLPIVTDTLENKDMHSHHMRSALGSALIVLGFALGSVPSATAQVSVGINAPGISIGVNLPVYPQLVRVPGYPVYYAPQVNSNYFFYDGLYWVFLNDNWYASTWYNGPWELVSDDLVPLFILRVPVRYYREPPSYFRGWASNSPPRWGDHWGNTWEQRHQGWDRWNRSAMPAPAPLPVYQRQYSGSRYPRPDEQRTLETRNYHYQPRETVARQQFQAQRTQASAPAASSRVTQQTPRTRGTQQAQQGTGAPASRQQTAAVPRGQAPQRGNADQQKAAVAKTPAEPRVQASRPPSPRGPQVATQRKPAQEPQTRPPTQAMQHKPAQEPQARPPTQSPRTEPQKQQSQQVAAQRQQAARAQGEARGPQGKEPAKESKEPAKESKQGSEKGREKSE
jgi:hypothetical protein